MPWPREAAETGHVAGLGSGLALPQCWKWGVGTDSNGGSFLPDVMGKLVTQEDNFTLKLAPLKISPRMLPTFSAQDPWP